MARPGPGKRAALAHLGEPEIICTAGGTGLRIAPVPGCGYLHLRLRPDDFEALGAAGMALGGELAREPNTARAITHGQVFWLGPDEWLLALAPTMHEQTAARLRQRMPAHSVVALTDLSAGRATLEISGRHGSDLLRKGCSLDLHPSRFRVGHCARTALAKANVLLWPVDGDAHAAWRLIVDRSYADYLWRWLADAAGEFIGAPLDRVPFPSYHQRPRSLS